MKDIYKLTAESPFLPKKETVENLLMYSKSFTLMVLNKQNLSRQCLANKN